ncbi:MAG: DUF1003 domain-containing protein [Zoogloeaceae bacterium]|nr:DUF1003 domain-containing protein [Zoogloeaceae bacterium]
MNHLAASPATCDVCHKHFPASQLVPAGLVRDTIASEIRHDLPDWGPAHHICRQDLAHYRARYVHSLLVSERGELSALEHAVVESIEHQGTVTANVEEDIQEAWTLGERLADHIARFGGSWAFLICFSVFIAGWIAANSLVLYWRPVDPYPFILLNLLLSCLAAIQAPIIMMSQNRQEAKDRLRARNDYQVNLKAELEIRHLHEKIDHLLSHQWERLVEIQEVQLDLLAELRRGR